MVSRGIRNKNRWAATENSGSRPLRQKDGASVTRRKSPGEVPGQADGSQAGTRLDRHRC